LFEIHYYDTVNFAFYKYIIKTREVQSIPIFFNVNPYVPESDLTFSNSFYSLIRSGSIYWCDYADTMDDRKLRMDAKREQEMHDAYAKLDYKTEAEFSKLNAVLAPLQTPLYALFIANDQFYYRLHGTSAPIYLTQYLSEDIVFKDSAFVKYVIKKINSMGENVNSATIELYREYLHRQERKSDDPLINAHTAAHDNAHTAAHDNAHTAAHDNAHTAAHDNAHTAAHDDAHTAAHDNVHTAAHDNAHTTAHDNAHTAAHDNAHTAAHDNAHEDA